MMEGSSRKSRVQDLTQRQIDVLARVSQFKSSKQIARELGISHHTVDQRIKTIIDRMGVGSRADAARAFLESRYDNGLSECAICDSLTRPIPDRADDPFLAELKPSPGEWNPAAHEQGQRLNEAQVFYLADAQRASEIPSLISVLLKADRHNELTAWGRAICIIATMMLTLMLVGSIVRLTEALSRLS